MPWKKNFDVDDALRKAGQTFWDKGYEATSMRDLLGAMGIQKGSFYDTYGSKRDVYLQALEQYASSRFDDFQRQAADLGPLDALRSLVELVHDECLEKDGHRGCMIVNCALELAHDDTGAQRVVQRSLEAHEAYYADLIRAGQAAGEIDASLDPAGAAKGMLGLVISMRVFARSGAPAATIRALADQALGLIQA